jgi:hypothetical protein
VGADVDERDAVELENEYDPIVMRDAGREAITKLTVETMRLERRSVRIGRYSDDDGFQLGREFRVLRVNFSKRVAKNTRLMHLAGSGRNSALT